MITKLIRPPLPAAADYDTPPDQQWQAAANDAIHECEAYLWGASPKAGAARGYLNGRGLSDETIKKYRLGYNNGDRKISGLWLFEGFTIPTIVYNDIWQIRTRTPPKHVGRMVFNGERVLKKYEGVTGNKIGLMGADRLATAHTAIICAGEFDSMLAQQFAPAGVACVTFGSEGKSVSLRWQIALRKIKLVIVAYDNDDAGAAGAFKFVDLKTRVKRAKTPTGKDVTEYYQHGGDIGAWIREITGIIGTMGTSATSCHYAISCQCADSATRSFTKNKMEDLDLFINDGCRERSTKCKCGKVMDNLKSKLAVYFESFLGGWDDRLCDCGEFILSQCPNCKKRQWWVLSSFHWGSFQPEEYFDSKAEKDFWDHLLHIYANNTSVMFRPQVAIKNGDSYFFMDFVKKSYNNITAFEVDGKTHHESKEYDKKRTEFLLANGVDAVRRYSVRFNKFSGFYLEGGQIERKFHQR